MEALNGADEAWIISSNSCNWATVPQTKFVEEVRKYHESGRGLALFSAGGQMVTESNAIASSLFGVSHSTTIWDDVSLNADYFERRRGH